MRRTQIGEARVANYLGNRTYSSRPVADCNGHGLCLWPLPSYIADTHSEYRAGLLHVYLPPAIIPTHRRLRKTIMASGEKIIGIDLGTTNSVVAIMEGSEPKVIANA